MLLASFSSVINETLKRLIRIMSSSLYMLSRNVLCTLLTSLVMLLHSISEKNLFMFFFINYFGKVGGSGKRLQELKGVERACR